MEMNQFLLFNFDKFISLEIVSENSQIKMNSFLIENKKGDVNIHVISLSDIRDKHYPILLNISIKDIISKQFRTENEAQNFLSNFNEEDFYFQKFNSENGMYINLIRKNKFKELIDQTKLNLEQIVAINLGGAICKPFLNRMFVPNKAIICGPHKYSFGEDAMEYALTPKEYEHHLIELSGEKIHKNQLIAFLSAMIFLDHAQGDKFLRMESVTSNRQKAIFRYNFQRLLKPILLCLLILLGLDFSFFAYLTDRKINLEKGQKELMALAILKDRLKNENQSLKKSIHSSVKILSIPLSYLLDQIGKETPKTIHLKRLTAFPPLKKPDQKEIPAYDYRKIFIVGSAKSNKDLSLWNECLKNLQFTESTVYNSISGNKHKTIDFELQLNLRP